MKKILISLFLVLVLAFSGCGCNPATLLDFSQASLGESATVGYSETRTYNVTFAENYSFGDDYDFSKNKSLKEKNVTYTFENGTYVTNLSIISVSDDLPFSSALLEESIAKEKYIIRLQTAFNITAKYSADGFAPHIDSVITDSYFMPSDASYAPIYSKTVNDSSHLNYTGDSAEVQTSKSTEEIVYNKDKYKVTKTIGTNKPETKEYGYTYRTLIDNTALLFALRNFKGVTEEGKAAVMPVVSSTYGEAKTLEVKYSKKQNLTINVGSEDVVFPVKALAFKISSSTASCIGGNNIHVGRAQLAFVQSGDAKVGDTVKTGFNAELVKYVQPLTAYGSFVTMGALEYTLVSVS